MTDEEIQLTLNLLGARYFMQAFDYGQRLGYCIEVPGKNGLERYAVQVEKPNLKVLDFEEWPGQRIKEELHKRINQYAAGKLGLLGDDWLKEYKVLWKLEEIHGGK